jgi:hypothetical protein
MSPLLLKIDHSKDYIIHVIPTPSNDDSNTKASKVNEKKENEVDSNWIVDHALQVNYKKSNFFTAEVSILKRERFSLFVNAF